MAVSEGVRRAFTLVRRGWGIARRRLSTVHRAWGKAKRWVGRLFGRTTITMNPEGNALQVVALKGGEVLRWATVPLDGNTPQGVRSVLGGWGMRGGRVVSALPLCTALVRPLPLPRVPRKHLSQVVLAEAPEAFPFSPGEVDLAWTSMRNGGGEGVLAVAVPKDAVDSVVAMLQQWGIRPKALYPKEVALSALVPHGLVVYLGGEDTALLLALEGIARVVYRVPLAREGDGEREAVLLASSIEQVLAYGRGMGWTKGGQPLPIVLAGNPERGARLAPLLERHLGRPLERLAVSLPRPPNFPIEAYAVNLGLALADRPERGGLVAPNLLPSRHRPRPVSLPLLVGLCAVVVLAPLAVWGTSRAEERVGEASRLSARLEEVRNQERLRRLALAQSTALERQAQGLESVITAVQGHLGRLRQEREDLGKRLGVLLTTAREGGVQVSAISVQADGFSLTGTADSFGDVLSYATRLRLSGLFGSVRLLRMGAMGGEGGRVAFQMKALAGDTPTAR
ncbi:hypothetical protein HRbin23_00991 [bacterium HR23]|nr:hypothetical protein HRbin23_00991 [bacterium HR23]